MRYFQSITQSLVVSTEVKGIESFLAALSKATTGAFKIGHSFQFF